MSKQIREAVTDIGIDASEKVSLKTKFGYAIGDLGANLAFQVTSFYLLFFFTDIFGILPALAGAIFLVSKIWDAVSDPIMGYVVDKTSTRWGRKRPYLLFGAIPLGLSIFLLFFAPDISQNMKFVYGMFSFIFFCTAVTVVNVPYLAITPTLTRDSQERAVVTGYRVFFGIAGTLIAAGATLPLSTLFNPNNQILAFRGVGALYGLIVAAVTLISFFAVKEKYIDKKKKKNDIKTVLRAVVKNKPFLIITAGTSLHIIAMSILAIVINYYFKYVMLNEGLVTVGFLCIFVTAAASIPIFVKITKKTSKKFAYNMGMGIVGLGLVLIFFFGNIHFEVFGVDIPLVFILLFISGFGLSTNWLSPWSILPDTIEYSEWKTGVRNEGSLYGIFYFVFKLGSAIGGFLVGNILALTGFVANIEQNADTVLAIKLLFTILPMLFILGGILFVSRFPITSQMHAEITQEIKVKND